MTFCMGKVFMSSSPDPDSYRDYRVPINRGVAPDKYGSNGFQSVEKFTDAIKNSMFGTYK
jgi:hypothetical protein